MTPEENARAAVLHYCLDGCGLGIDSRECENCIEHVTIEALDKRIPRRYVESKGKTRLGETLIGFCPSCGEGTNSDMPFCPMCGQAIEWKVRE